MFGTCYNFGTTLISLGYYQGQGIIRVREKIGLGYNKDQGKVRVRIQLGLGKSQSQGIIRVSQKGQPYLYSGQLICSGLLKYSGHNFGTGCPELACPELNRLVPNIKCPEYMANLSRTYVPNIWPSRTSVAPPNWTYDGPILDSIREIQDLKIYL